MKSTYPRGAVWLTNDLRLRDNETLMQAISDCEEVLIFYCLDEKLRQRSPFGFKRIGGHRFTFLLQSLSDLDTQLRELGSGLFVFNGRPEVEIPKFVEEYQIDQLYCQSPIASEERQTLQHVVDALAPLGKGVIEKHTSALYRPSDLHISQLPDLFTAFRKQVENKMLIPKPLEAPSHISGPSIPPLALPIHQSWGLEKPESHPHSAFPFAGGEMQAWERLNDYLFQRKLVFTYKETRNGLLGESYSTKFSPWLALGCISSRSIYWEIKKAEEQWGANDSTYWVYFELLWRDFFQWMMLKHGAKYFLAGGLTGQKPASKPDESKVQAWIKGETGDPFVDANMKELRATGFMSNRGRQNVASYFCKVLQQDWRIGAAYFEEALIDYDPCSNYGNWAYVAGVGNDNRSDRFFNTQKQAEMYDPDGQYRNLWNA